LLLSGAILGEDLSRSFLDVVVGDAIRSRLPRTR
jgi:hypothetical protein